MFARLTPLAVLLTALHTAPVAAQSTMPQSQTGHSVEMIVGGVEPTDPATIWLGLKVNLDPGWHTYWRSPGDAGAAPEFDWSGSRNVSQAIVEWPAPRRFSDSGIDTIGYAGEVLFPIKIQPRDRSAPTHVSLKLTLYVCSTICTRRETQLDADIAPNFRAAEQQALIDRWHAKVPRASSASLSIKSVRLEPGPQAQLRLEVAADPPLSGPDAFVDGDSAIDASRPQIATGPDRTSIVTLALEGPNAAHPNRPLRVTLVDGARAVEATLPPQRAEPPLQTRTPTASDGPHPDAASLWPMIALSLLGGFVLNFMPCVFPVLSLKLFSLAGPVSTQVRSIRAHFIASGAGIIASFIVLAAILSTLKAAGAEIGWGIQFQQPLFLIGIAITLTAVAANLLGLYEIRLPWWLAGSLGQSADVQPIASHFFNGFVMTLLATPCSAPFVGTAVAFALSQGTVQIFSIFAGLGLGMASPYLALAAIPRVARLFPRPGRWMLAIRPIAAAAMAATALWLLTVLAEISGVQTALVIGAALGFLIWLLAAIRQRFAHTIAAVLIVTLAGSAVLVADGGPRREVSTTGPDVRWQPFAPARIQALTRSGQTVFVDIGAAWCITCKVNEALIIDSDSIRERLNSDVIPVRADWTRPDGAISAYLQKFGRYGLPFNAVFGPGAPDGIVLPEILTREAVLKAFDTAANIHTSP